MTFVDYLLIGIILCAIGAAIHCICKHRKKGGCCGNCANCDGCH